MSKQEFSRLEVLLRVQSGRLRVSDACVLIGLQRRQVFRLLRGLKQDGATSLLSKRRGRPSNHRLPAEVRALALSIPRVWVRRSATDTRACRLVGWVRSPRALVLIIIVGILVPHEATNIQIGFGFIRK